MLRSVAKNPMTHHPQHFSWIKWLLPTLFGCLLIALWIGNRGAKSRPLIQPPSADLTKVREVKLKNEMVISLPFQTPAEVANGLVTTLSSEVGAGSVKWNPEKATLTLSYPAAAAAPKKSLDQLRKENPALADPSVGVVYSYVMGAGSHESSCAMHAYLKYQEIERTPGVVRVARYIPQAGGEVEIVVHPEQITSEAITTILNNSPIECEQGGNLAEQPARF